MFVFYRRQSKWPVALLLAILFLFVALIQGCGEKKPQLHTHMGMTMGTSFTVKWFSADSDNGALKARINSLLAGVNQSMSTYIQDSELSLINQQPAGYQTVLSKELAAVLAQALQISSVSDGAFDVTVGPLVNLWGFGPDGRIVKAPTDQEIAALRGRVGYGYLNFNPATLALEKTANAYIDLSAIAKGYAVDQIAELLSAAGINSYLVEIGGELRANGVKPDGKHWRIAVEKPDSATARTVQAVINVKDVAIATSGDYRNYFEENGQRFSHTIDPLTGKPITHRLASVTVLMPTCAEADALATTLMVMGPERGYEFAVAQGIHALFIVKTDQGFVERQTPGFDQYIVQ